MNIYDFPKGRLDKEFVEILLKSDNIRIERIVSTGHTTDWYDQSEDEWVCLLKGEAELEFEDKSVSLNEGDTIFIPKHQKHRVAKTTECIWLCVLIK